MPRVSDELVAAHAVVKWIQISKVLGRREFAGMMH